MATTLNSLDSASSHSAPEAAGSNVTESAPGPWRAWVLLGMLLAATVALKWPVLSLPYHADEIVYVHGAHYLSEVSWLRILPGLHPPEAFHGHPPLTYLVLSIGYRLLGDVPRTGHLVILGFSLVTLIYTYRLGALLAGERAGLIAAALLLATPMFFAQSVLVHGDMPVAAAGTAVLFYFLRRQTTAYLVAASLMLMFKETSLLIVAACAIATLLREQPRWTRQAWKQAVLIASPAALLGAFFLLQRLATGTTLNNPYFADHALIQFKLVKLLFIATFVFFWHGQWALTAAIVLGAAVARRRAWRPELGLFLLVVVLFVAGFTVVFTLPRYFVPLLPLVAITAAVMLEHLARGVAWRHVLLAGLVALPLVNARASLFSETAPLDSTMIYTRAVRLQQQTCDYIARHLPQRSIVSQRYFESYLRAPAYGYVSKPVRYYVMSIMQVEPSRHVDGVIVLSWELPADRAALEQMIDERGFELLVRFEEAPLAIELYGPSPISDTPP